MLEHRGNGVKACTNSEQQIFWCLQFARPTRRKLEMRPLYVLEWHGDILDVENQLRFCFGEVSVAAETASETGS